MKTSPTYLRTLQNHLCGRGKKIFPNQVVFYNAVFGATNPLLLSEEHLDALFRIGQGGRRKEDEELIRQVNYLLRSGLDSNSANIGKHINNVPELPIPRQHRSHYEDEANRADIVRRLQAIIGFCLFFRPVNCRMEREDMAELLARMKEELAEASRTLRLADELSVELLANVIYEVVITHLAQVQSGSCVMPEDTERRKVDLDAQYQEYWNQVSCFGRDNADHFFALQRLAQTNMVAAMEMGKVYFYGGQYYAGDEGRGNPGVYRVEPDMGRAALYLKQAADCDPPVIAACWLLGYMIWNRMFDDVPEGEAEALAESYFRTAYKGGYMPAANSMGLIELARGDRLFAREEKLLALGERLTGAEQEQMYAHYRRGLTLCDEAGCAGWPYGHINVASFLGDERYRFRVMPAVCEGLSLRGSMDVRERWKAAADLDNLWAMNRLALYDMERGDVQSALSYWQRAASCHYPAASLNMALYIYSDTGAEPNRYQYRACLEQASADGSARASYELAALLASGRPETAGIYLARAEEQNDQKFDNELYHQIRDLQKKLEKRERETKRSDRPAFGNVRMSAKERRSGLL